MMVPPADFAFLVDVATSLKRFEGDNDDLRRWLFTIARRRMIDAFRTRTRRPEDATADLPHEPTAEGADASIERLEWAEEILSRLPPTQAEVVMLRTIVGFSVAEVAELIDKSPGAVRVLAHRGLERVLELLAEQGTVSSKESAENLAGTVTETATAAMVPVQ